MNLERKLIIYTDGGSRGNPGPAAIGVLISDPSARASSEPQPNSSGQGKRYSDLIGEATNNVAEYKALIFALKKAKHLIGGNKAAETEIEVRSDSELIVSQLKGKYKIKDEELKPLFIDVWNLKQEFKSVEFKLIPRSENKIADMLLNDALNETEREQSKLL